MVPEQDRSLRCWGAGGRDFTAAELSALGKHLEDGSACDSGIGNVLRNKKQRPAILALPLYFSWQKNKHKLFTRLFCLVLVMFIINYYVDCVSLVLSHTSTCLSRRSCYYNILEVFAIIVYRSASTGSPDRRLKISVMIRSSMANEPPNRENKGMPHLAKSCLRPSQESRMSLAVIGQSDVSCMHPWIDQTGLKHLPPSIPSHMRVGQKREAPVLEAETRRITLHLTAFMSFQFKYCLQAVRRTYVVAEGCTLATPWLLQYLVGECAFETAHNGSDHGKTS